MSPAVRTAVVVLRVWIGLNLFFAHGLPMARDPEALLESGMLASLPSPELFGWAAILAEVVGGPLLALGLLTRTAASALLLTMLGAAFVAHGSDPWVEKELSLTYAAVLLFFVAYGPGGASVDGELERRRRKSSPF